MLKLEKDLRSAININRLLVILLSLVIFKGSIMLTDAHEQNVVDCQAIIDGKIWIDNVMGK